VDSGTIYERFTKTALTPHREGCFRITKATRHFADSVSFRDIVQKYVEIG
jgi:hypothetical protein